MSNLDLMWDQNANGGQGGEIPVSMAEDFQQPRLINENAATGFRAWNDGNKIVGVGVPSAPAKPDQMAGLESEVNFWDEPVQPSEHPRYQQNLEEALKDVARSFTAAGPNATLKDAKDILNRVAAKYSYDTPEIIPAIKAAVKNRLPGSAGSELSNIKSQRDTLRGYRTQYDIVNQMESEWQKEHPGMYKDLKTGRVTPIAETADDKRKQAMQAKVDELNLLNDSGESAAKEVQAQPGNHYVAIYNKGTLGKKELVPVDTSDEAIMDELPKTWTLAMPALRDYKQEKAVKRWEEYQAKGRIGKLFSGTSEQPVNQTSNQPPAAPAVSPNDANGNGIDDRDEKFMRWAKQNKDTNPLEAAQIIEKLKRKYPKSFGG